MVVLPFISGRDPGDENDGPLAERPLAHFRGPWHEGFPGVPRGTSQPELNIPPFDTFVMVTGEEVPATPINIAMDWKLRGL